MRQPPSADHHQAVKHKSAGRRFCGMRGEEFKLPVPGSIHQFYGSCLQLPCLGDIDRILLELTPSRNDWRS